MTEHSTGDTPKTHDETNLVQPVEAEKVAVPSSPKKEKILSVTVHLKNPTVFTLGYRSHDELYRRFQEKLNALGIPPDQIYLEDTMTGQPIATWNRSIKLSERVIGNDVNDAPAEAGSGSEDLSGHQESTKP
nr:unnamed protein product [Haemonchus contortus]